MTKKKYIKRAYSHSPLRSYTWNTDFATVHPNFSFQKVLSMVESDPVARGAIQHYVDKCMEGGYSIIRREDLKYDSQEELRLMEKYNFRRDLVAKVFRLGKLFNNVFIEIVRTTDGQTKGLNILDSQTVDPITEPNGDPIKFRSNIPHPKTGEYPEWRKEDIVWIKFGDLTKGYAPVDLKALWETLLAKEYITRYVAWLWKTGQYRILYNPKGGSDKDIEDFISFAKRHDENYRVPFIFKGDLETKILRDVKETESIVGLLKYYDNQILINLRVQPVDAGMPDTSGRSNADAQTNSLNTSIIAFKKVAEDSINFDLFPKMKKGKILLRFGPTDRFAEGQVFQNVQIMKSMGMSNEAVKEYFGDKGMYWSARLFDPAPDMDQGGPDNPKDKDAFVSRQRGVDGEGNKEQEEVTTREDQLKRSE